MGEYAYVKNIDTIFDPFFKKYSYWKKGFQSRLVETIIACFHTPAADISKQTKALLILERIFFTISQNTHAPFSLVAFIKLYKISQRDQKKLLTSLLYGIYFKELPLVELRYDLLWMVMQTLSEKVSLYRLKTILRQMTIEQHSHLLVFLFKRYREGSYIILHALKQICFSGASTSLNSNHRKLLLNLIAGLTSKVYDANLFFASIKQASKIDEAILENVLIELRLHAQQTIKNCFYRFKKLVDLIVKSPFRVFESMNISNSLQGKEEALWQQNYLQKLLQDYFDSKYSFEDFEMLLKFMGLYGQMPYIRIGDKDLITTGVVDKISILLKIFKNPLQIAHLKPAEIQSSLHFILVFILHLKKMTRLPNTLKEDLNLLTYAIATRGKDLNHMSSLTSILEGIRSIYLCSSPILSPQISMLETPIFIFDQSQAKLFKKNQNYIHQLNTHYKSSIVHISQDQALSLARKIGVENLIDTTGSGQMGYGGSRNCIFLLAPLLKHLFKLGKTSVLEILKLDNKLMLELFRQTILQNDPKMCNTIFMTDDDMAIPTANFFSYALFAHQTKMHYVFTHGFCIGRATKYLNKFRDLEEILNNPAEIFDFAQWLDIPFSVKMAEYVGKPKICLNLPFGQEESHLKIDSVFNPFLQLSHHLGGTRFPSQQIPTHFFVGLESHLKYNIPYVFGISLSMDLIDPSNLSNRCILPWNDDPAIKFKNLGEVFCYISENKNNEEIQRRFWKNVKDLFQSPQEKPLPLRQDIDKLRQMDIANILKSFKMVHKLDPSENRSLSAIGNIYKLYQRDANLFWEYGTYLIKIKIFELSTTDEIRTALEDTKAVLEKKHRIKLSHYPITYHFFLMCHSLGAGEFSQIIGNSPQFPLKIMP